MGSKPAPLEENLEGLSDRDLLEILVGERAAKRLLKEAGGLPQLARWDLVEIMSRANVPEKAAQRLHAALIVGRRGMNPIPRGQVASSSHALYKIFLNKVGPHLHNERFYVALLDASLQLIGVREVSRGTTDATIVHPRDVIRLAALEHAHAVAVAHNHPSGLARPSHEDIALTRRLIAALDLAGVRMVDHLVIGADDYYSFADHGMLRE